jgi:hypothetical protein
MHNPRYDPYGRIELTKQMWARTAAWNAAHSKNMAASREAKRQFFPGPGPVNNGKHRGGGGLFWLAVLAVAGVLLLLP